MISYQKFTHPDDLINSFFSLMHSMREFISLWADYCYIFMRRLFLFVKFISFIFLFVRLDSTLFWCVYLWCAGWCLNMSICALFLKLLVLNNVEVLLLSSFPLNSYVKVKEGMTIWSPALLFYLCKFFGSLRFMMQRLF